MALDAFFVLVLQLAAGIVAIQDPGQPVSPDNALKYATAVAYHADRNHLDPWEMVGIARNESDFRPDQVGPDGKDCGITQTRVTFSKYRCAELRRNVWIAFQEAARELVENQARCERFFKSDLTRCRVNGYNSGIHYARSGYAGGYWLRVACFAEAARRGVRPVGDCRRVHDRGDIAQLIERSEDASSAPTVVAGGSSTRSVAAARAPAVRAR